MKQKPIANECGEYINCAFYSEISTGKRIKSSCTALKDWYNESRHNCKGCPFFKTREQLDNAAANRMKT